MIEGREKKAKDDDWSLGEQRELNRTHFGNSSDWPEEFKEF